MPAPTSTLRRALALLLLAGGAAAQQHSAQQHSAQQHSARQHSALWGERGELWDPAGRLPDFSFAGYRHGEAPLPDVAVACNVRDFGALGDGEHDDTAAFRAAIEATDAGAILVPPGRFVITDILWIRKPNVVLRGAGADSTTLVIPAQLEDVRPNMGATTSGQPTSNYSWSGGFVWAQGRLGVGAPRAITSSARYGERSFTVASAEGLAVGQRVQVSVNDDDERSLLDHLYAGQPGDTREVRKAISARFVSRIAAVDGERLTLERTLRFDLRPEWRPTLGVYEPTVSEVGVEHLAFEFPSRPYGGHFTERGANAIAMTGVADCWVRDVVVRNADSGLFVTGDFCTVRGLVLESAREPSRGAAGHHGVTLGTDVLLEDFDFRTHFIHDVTLSYGHAGNVVKNGRGVNLSLDHHKRANHSNLFCNLDAGDGAELWRCGGGASLGRNTGARATFWAIRTARLVAWPPREFGPDRMNLVGLHTEAKTIRDADGRWFEAFAPETLEPADLHAAQLARRLAARAARQSDDDGR